MFPLARGKVTLILNCRDTSIRETSFKPPTISWKLYFYVKDKWHYYILIKTDFELDFELTTAQ